MTISASSWVNFVTRLSALDKAATEKVEDFLNSYNGHFDYSNPQHMRMLIAYSNSISQVYGEAAAALACEMYDAAGVASGVLLDPALPAEPPNVYEVANTIVNVADTMNPNIIGSRVGRLVKKTGAKTTIQNAKRDGLKVAWIPHGDTCAYCIALASRGWEDAGYYEDNMHLHSNCDCTYGVKYTKDTNYGGYDPQTYKDLYYGAPVPEGQKITAKSRINALRREAYAENKEVINAQKRAAYAKKKERESSAAEEINVN